MAEVASAGPDEPAGAAGPVLDTTDGRRPATVVVELARADGTPAVLAVRGSMVSWDGAENQLLVIEDLTQQTATERRLIAVDARSRLQQAVVESSEDAILTKTLDGVITGWNPAAEQLYGYPAGEAIGARLDIIVPPERRAEFAGVLARIRRGESVRHLETTRQRKDGRVLPVSLTVSPVRDEHGVVVGASTISRDLGTVRQADRLLRAVVEWSPVGLVLVAEDGRIELINTATEAIFGYRPGELTGRSIETLVPSGLRERHVGLRDGYLAQPSARAMGAGRDLLGVRADGSSVPVEVGLTPVQLSGHQLVAAVVTDITTRVRERELAERRAQELERSNDDLSRFAYIASHDLQAPLRAVVNYSELLAELYKGRLDAQADRYLRYTVEGGRRMQRLVTDLLTYSRVDRQPMPSARVSSAAVLRRVLAELAGEISRCDGQVSAGDLPVVAVDETQLGQIFANLISNALKFRAADRPPRVTVDARRAELGVVFSVADNGIGIPADQQAEVFEMFRRLHAQSDYPGSGIGLSIVARAVQRYGGRIWVESWPGTGSTFHFVLPDRMPVPAPEPVPEPVPAG
jgi:PAS domain S-box-containing protein